MKGNEPLLGMSTFNDQPSLVRYVDKEKGRGVDQKSLESVFEKAVPVLSNTRYTWMVGSRGGLRNVLTISSWLRDSYNKRYTIVRLQIVQKSKWHNFHFKKHNGVAGVSWLDQNSNPVAWNSVSVSEPPPIAPGEGVHRSDEGSAWSMWGSFVPGQYDSSHHEVWSTAVVPVSQTHGPLLCEFCDGEHVATSHVTLCPASNHGSLGRAGLISSLILGPRRRPMSNSDSLSSGPNLLPQFTTPERVIFNLVVRNSFPSGRPNSKATAKARVRALTVNRTDKPALGSSLLALRRDSESL